MEISLKLLHLECFRFSIHCAINCFWSNIISQSLLNFNFNIFSLILFLIFFLSVQRKTSIFNGNFMDFFCSLFSCKKTKRWKIRFHLLFDVFEMKFFEVFSRVKFWDFSARGLFSFKIYFSTNSIFISLNWNKFASHKNKVI